MKRQNHIPVPSARNGLRWTILCASAAVLGIIVAQAFLPSLSSLEGRARDRLLPDSPVLFRLMDVVVLSHLAFTAAASFAASKPVLWREGDAARTVHCFRSSPPGWSWWYAGMTVVSYALPHVTSLVLPATTWETTTGSGVHSPALSLLSAAQGAFVVVLVSAAVWSWVTWIFAFTPVTFGGPVPPALRLYGSGSTLMLEHDHGIELLRVFGMRDGPWDPCCLLVRDRMPTYRLSGQEPEREDFVHENAPILDSPGGRLVLPASVGAWVGVGVVSGAAVAACLAAGWTPLLPVILLGAVAVGLLVRDRRPSSTQFQVKLWNWGSSVPFLRRVYVGGGGALWFLLLAIHGGVAPWTFDVLWMSLLLWIPFWLGFVEPRRFIRLRRSRLQLRMHSVWLPLTDAQAPDERRLDLWCGPLRVPIGTQAWMGPQLSCFEVVERMKPYFSFWEPSGRTT